jgi:hypothetical protein
MQPRKILADLKFVKEVPAKRQTYYVYESKESYILMTVSKGKDSFNFNVVSKDATDYVRKAFKGRQKLTSSDVVKESKKPAYIKESFDALNILYALCALGDAKIDKRYVGIKLFFNIRKL